jgi:hypothetical protein
MDSPAEASKIADNEFWAWAASDLREYLIVTYGQTI